MKVSRSSGSGSIARINPVIDPSGCPLTISVVSRGD
ncbi:hypothetical protein MHAS44199_07540 [Mycolicibacterium hassiacum DSM 44199]|nr:hypothetical protein [Mycolicibacterium hassiacum DSM 44199]